MSDGLTQWYDAGGNLYTHESDPDFENQLAVHADGKAIADTARFAVDDPPVETQAVPGPPSPAVEGPAPAESPPAV